MNSGKSHNLSGHLQFLALTFFLSTLITGLFIRAYGGYVSSQTMLLSGSIAGGKWAIQMGAGYFLLGDRKWIYLRQLASTCLAGSVLLIPFAIFGGSVAFFIGSLAVCVVVMTGILVFWQRTAGFSWRWQALWLGLLATAITLQLTVVFHII